MKQPSITSGKEQEGHSLKQITPFEGGPKNREAEKKEQKQNNYSQQIQAKNSKNKNGNLQEPNKQIKRKRRKKALKSCQIWAFKTKKPLKKKVANNKSEQQNPLGRPIKRIKKSQKGIRLLKSLIGIEISEPRRTRSWTNKKQDMQKYVHMNQPIQVQKIKEESEQMVQQQSVGNIKKKSAILQPADILIPKSKSQQKKSQKWKQKLEKKNQLIVQLQRKNRELESKYTKLLQKRLIDLQNRLQLKNIIDINVLPKVDWNDLEVKIQ